MVELLPIRPPLDHPQPWYSFYNTSRLLIPDLVKMMANGIGIDMEKVYELDNTVEEITSTCVANLNNNSLLIAKYVELRETKLREKRYDELQQQYDNKVNKPIEIKITLNSPHFTKYINAYLDSIGELQMYGLPDGSKWTKTALKKINILLNDAHIADIINGTIQPKLAPLNAVERFVKAERDNKHLKVLLDKKDEAASKSFKQQFNPRSADQKAELLWGMLGITSDKLTDTGNYSYGRRSLETLLQLVDGLLEG